jgi:hypothetical protein
MSGGRYHQARATTFPETEVADLNGWIFVRIDLNPRRFRANRLLQALQRLIAKGSFFRSRNGSRRAFRRIIQH